MNPVAAICLWQRCFKGDELCVDCRGVPLIGNVGICFREYRGLAKNAALSDPLSNLKQIVSKRLLCYCGGLGSEWMLACLAMTELGQPGISLTSEYLNHVVCMPHILLNNTQECC